MVHRQVPPVNRTFSGFSAVLAIALTALLMFPAAHAAPEPWTTDGGDMARDGFAESDFVAPTISLLASQQYNDPIRGSPLAVDLNGDGDLEVIFATGWDQTSAQAVREIYLEAWDYDVGTGSFSLIDSVQPFVPNYVDGPAEFGGIRVAVGDLRGDETPEFVIQGLAYEYNQVGGGGVSFSSMVHISFITLLEWDRANNYWSLVFYSDDAPYVNGVNHDVAPVIGDIDGDGTNEYVHMTTAGGIQAWDWSGAATPSLKWRQTLPNANNDGNGPIPGTALNLADIDPTRPGDEVVFAGHFFANQGFIYTCYPTQTAGNCVNVDVAYGYVSGALGDFTGDGAIDAAFGTYSSATGMNIHMYEYDKNSPGHWSLEGADISPGGVIADPIIMDVNGDGIKDIITLEGHLDPSIDDNGGDLIVYEGGAYNKLGTLSRDATLPNDRRILAHGAGGNILGTDKPEAVFASTEGLEIVEFDVDGAPSILQSFPKTDIQSASGAILADVTGDCALDIIVGWDTGLIEIYGHTKFVDKPTDVRDFAVTEDGENATLTWKAPLSDGGRPIEHYNIYRASPGGTTLELHDQVEMPGLLEFVDKGVGPGRYDYAVSAENCAKEGPVTPLINIDVHKPPFKVTAEEIVMEDFTDHTLTKLDLHYDDDLWPLQPDKVDYELVLEPTLGVLTVAGIELEAGDQFTQEQIDLGLVNYQHVGLPGQTPPVDPVRDGLYLKAIDEEGKATDPFTLPIYIIPDFELPVLLRNSGAEVIQFGSVTFDNTSLWVWDYRSEANNVTYCLDKAPLYGFAQATPGIGQTPTPLVEGQCGPLNQTMVDQQLFSYNHDSFTVADDAIGFRVIDEDGNEATFDIPIYVTPAELPRPSIDMGLGPYFHDVPVLFRDQSSKGTYPLDQTKTEWTFSSGASATGALVREAFCRADEPNLESCGKHWVTMTVFDEKGLSASATREFVTEGFIPATPQFYMSKSTVEVGEEVSFWDVSKAGIVPLVGREWDFQDSHEPTADESVVHAFSEEGVYTVTLTIIDDAGFRYYAASDVNVVTKGTLIPEEDFSEPIQISQLKEDALAALVPSAEAGPDQIVLQGTIVKLDGSKSRPGPAGSTLTYQWKHRAGLEIAIVGADTATPLISIPYVNSKSEEILLELVVTDNSGAMSAPDIIRLVVKAEGLPSLPPVAAPAAKFTADQLVGGEVAFNALDKELPGVTYVWDFGDGTTLESSEALQTHRYAEPGEYLVRLTVTDGFHRVATHQKAVQMQNTGVIAESAEVQDVEIENDEPRSPIVAIAIIFTIAAVAAVGVFIALAIRGRKD